MADTPWFFPPLRQHIPGVVEAAEGAIAAVMRPSVIDRKYKLLMTLALDIAAGAPLGVQHMADLCRAAGATEAEIGDTLSVAFMHGALRRLAVGSLALDGVTAPTIDQLRDRTGGVGTASAPR